MRRGTLGLVSVALLFGSAAQAHEHTAPHGGALIELGEEVAHIELVLDAATGELTAYVLDGEAEAPVRIAAPALTIHLAAGQPSPGQGVIADADRSIALTAVANPLTGESQGDTSEFRGRSAVLRGAVGFEATIVRVEVRGQTFEGVRFRYPDGNE